MKITKESLKKLVREAYEEEMGSEDESGEGYEALLKDIGDKLKEAAEKAKSLGKGAEYSDLRSMMVTIDELTRMHKQNSDEDFDDEPEEEDEGMLKESVKRKFALLANIKHKK